MHVKKYPMLMYLMLCFVVVSCGGSSGGGDQVNGDPNNSASNDSGSLEGADLVIIPGQKFDGLSIGDSIAKMVSLYGSRPEQEGTPIDGADRRHVWGFHYLDRPHFEISVVLEVIAQMLMRVRQEFTV